MSAHAGYTVGARSLDAFGRAWSVFADGTTRNNTPREATQAGPVPRYIERGEGAHVYDVDGRRFLDCSGNFGTLVHGHAFGPVVEAVTRQTRRGTCFTGPTAAEIDLAELLIARIPCAETVRFAGSGSEAVMLAIRAARAFTGKPAIMKIEGAYHGGYEWAQVSQTIHPGNWGDVDRPASVAPYRGAPPTVADDVVMMRFNAAAQAVTLIERHAHRLAAILFDPLPSRLGFIPPTPEYLTAVSAAAKRHGIVLIVDEVLNFRLDIGGGAPCYGLQPDIVTLGKLIGGGLPLGAIAGRRDLLGMFAAAPGGAPVSHGDTFTGNVLSMVAGAATLTALDTVALARINRLGAELRGHLAATIARHDAPLSVTGEGSFFRVHPMSEVPEDYRAMLPGPAGSALLAAMIAAFAVEGMIIPMDRAPSLTTVMTDAEVAAIGQVFERFVAGAGDALSAIDAAGGSSYDGQD